MQTLDAIHTRRSIRAYLPTPVPQEVIAQVLEAGRWAPSGTNRQNWRVTVATGEPLRRLVERMDARVRETRPALSNPDSARPEVKPRVQALRAGLQEIADALDKPLWEFLIAGSYRFFDAPVMLAVSHRGGSAANIDPFVTTLLLAAHDLGLGTCWLGYPLGAADLIQEELGIPEDERVRAIVALGYPDLDSPAATFRSSREEVESFVKWVGFGP
jgi:nitroreductase